MRKQFEMSLTSTELPNRDRFIDFLENHSQGVWLPLPKLNV